MRKEILDDFIEVSIPIFIKVYKLIYESLLYNLTENILNGKDIEECIDNFLEEYPDFNKSNFSKKQYVVYNQYIIVSISKTKQISWIFSSNTDQWLNITNIDNLRDYILCYGQEYYKGNKYYQDLVPLLESQGFNKISDDTSLILEKDSKVIIISDDVLTKDYRLLDVKHDVGLMLYPIP
jgi:hypothetical protein